MEGRIVRVPAAKLKNEKGLRRCWKHRLKGLTHFTHFSVAFHTETSHLICSVNR